ncbi:MAG: hypothetical protein OD814_001606 [Candidatus Alkanophagales archaeon MCA70_species_1]|nr:hypothetical protein [Candidatus Alkanophaga volatiphilum]
MYSISSSGSRCGSKGPCRRIYSVISCALILVMSKAGSSKRSTGPTSLPSAIWKPAAITRGGPSKRVHRAFLKDTGMIGPLCEPRIQPETRCGKAKGSRTSPSAGSPDCARTSATGSSLPTYFSAIWYSFSVLITATGSSLGSFGCVSFGYTLFMTYLDFAPMRARIS